MIAPVCSIVIAVSNRAALTDQCLRSLLGSPPTTAHEIIVVDDASVDATPHLLESYSDRVSVVIRAERGGRAASRNDGAREARGDYIVFLDNDMLPAKGWLDALTRYAERTPQAAVTGCKLLHPDDTVQHAGIVFTQEKQARYLYAGFPADHPGVNRSRPFQAVSTAALLVRRELFLEGGGFEPSLEDGYDGIDLCLRLAEAGHEIHYCHESVLHRLGTPSRDGDGLSSRLYEARWKDRVKADDLAYYVDDGLLELRYADEFPIELAVSPFLANVDGGERNVDVERLLAARSHKVSELLQINASLRAKLADAQLTLGAKPEPFAAIEVEEAGRTEEPIVLPEHAEPEVSILVPAYNAWAATRACLRSIAEHTEGAYEVLLADDGSSDETARAEELVENLVVVRGRRRRGFLRNCNHAAKRARGRILVLLNNDVLVRDGWLDQLLLPFEADEQVGIVGPKLLYPSGRLQEAGGIIWRDGTGVNYGRLDDPDKPEYNFVREVDYVSGACLAIRADLWRELGGFDERFKPAYYEDTDLAFEARKRGFKVVYQPHCAVIHYEGVSHGRDEIAGVKRHQEINRHVFVDKWRDVLETEHSPSGTDLYVARDRSREQTTLLVVDHHVPHYDMDAGGRSTFQYLELARELGYRVVFVGDDYWPHEPYTSKLQKLGIEVLYGDHYAANLRTWMRDRGPHLDYVQLHRPQIAARYIDVVRQYAPQARVAYVPVDLHYVRELRRYETVGDPDARARSEEWKTVEFDLIAQVDSVQVFSSHEAEMLAKSFPHKSIRRIPLFILETRSERPKLPFAHRRDLLFVGGFQHPPNVDGVLWFTRNVLPTIRAEIPEARLLVVGSKPPPVIRALEGDQVVVTGYLPDDELEHLYDLSRLVVAPLRYGAGVKGKIVEAMHYGVPVVTTSIGAEGLRGQTNDHLVVVDDPEAFAVQVVNLYGDEDLWRRVQEAGTAFVAENFSTETASKQFLAEFPLRSRTLRGLVTA